MTEGFGLGHIWLHGDAVIRVTMVFLILMSVASWAVMLRKAFEVWMHRRAAQDSEGFWHCASFQEGLGVLALRGDSFFHELARTAQDASEHHRAAQAQLHDRLDVSEWITRSLHDRIDDCTGRLQGGLTLLASIGSTAPFVGLFGTVWGIYHALVGIGMTGEVGLDKVAGPIGETLIMTALGLVVAIPAVLGYNALTRSNRFLLAKLQRFAHDLHAYFVTGTAVAQRQAQGRAAVPTNSVVQEV